MRILSLYLILILHCTIIVAQEKKWMLGPFVRMSEEPIISPDSNFVFIDPITNSLVNWSSMATFNPAATIKNDSMIIIYRSEEKLNSKIIGGHRSRLGMASTTDGIKLNHYPYPIFYPNNDLQINNEWPGGVEDPRIVKSEDGMYFMTYTQWNRKIPRLALASSEDLFNWTKYGPIFKNWKEGKYNMIESKSGAIITELKNNELYAAKINGKYWMYYGVPNIWMASSEDLIHWIPLEDSLGNRIKVLSPRLGYFDNWLVEAGPPPIITDDGIVCLYNAGNRNRDRDKSLVNNSYSAGQALFDKSEPWKLLDRSTKPFLKPELEFEKKGQYTSGTTFIEGIVYFNKKWFLFYGAADNFVGVVVAVDNE